MFNIKINGKEIETDGTKTILECALENGIEIPNLCKTEGLAPYGACGVCVVEGMKDGKVMPKLIRSCSQYPAPGCEYTSESEKAAKTRKLALELMMSDHDGDCIGPCVLACPAHTQCQKYIKQIAQRDYEGAVATIKEVIPVPASIGRICPHPCEKDCRRQNVEESISIAYLKAFAADMVLAEGNHVIPECAEPTGKSAGIIGGGPAGLSAAFRLAQNGVKVTIYDKMPKMGGMLRYGIPEYRLPKAVLDAELSEMQSMGIEFVNDFEIGKDGSVEDIKAKHDVLLIANGAWKSSSVRCRGEELPGVFGGIDFLREVALGGKPEIGTRTAIVGGGNTAMDACRTAKRVGAEKVYVIYRRTRAEMPAEDIEIEEAMEEGVEFLFLTNPDEIIAGEDGKVCGVKLQVMELGEPDEKGRRKPVPVEGKFIDLELDSVIIAAGQKNDPSGFEKIPATSRGTIAADENTQSTEIPGVFAAGDTTNSGAGIAIAAINEGNKAADGMLAYLTGEKQDFRENVISKRNPKKEVFEGKEKIARAVMPTVEPQVRNKSFCAVNLGFSEEQAVAEAKRCLECGCHDYGECKLIKYADNDCVNCSHFCGEKHLTESETKLVSIERNRGKCILCGACVRVCEEKVGKGILGLVGRGFTTVIKPEFRNDRSTTDYCAGCMECADNCPTGALKILG